jgi:hypothetical protein
MTIKDDRRRAVPGGGRTTDGYPLNARMTKIIHTCDLATLTSNTCTGRMVHVSIALTTRVPWSESCLHSSKSMRSERSPSQLKADSE